MRETSEDESSIAVFDSSLNYNQNQIDAFFKRGRHKILDVHYLSQ